MVRIGTKAGFQIKLFIGFEVLGGLFWVSTNSEDKLVISGIGIKGGSNVGETKLAG